MKILNTFYNFDEEVDSLPQLFLQETFLDYLLSFGIDEENDYNEDTFTMLDNGSVLSIGDGICQVYGLKNIMVGEMVQFLKGGIKGVALNLSQNSVGIIIFGQDSEINQGDAVARLYEIVSLPVSSSVLGNILDPLGNTIDSNKPLEDIIIKMVEGKAPGIMPRHSINTFIQQPYYYLSPKKDIFFRWYEANNKRCFTTTYGGLIKPKDLILQKIDQLRICFTPFTAALQVFYINLRRLPGYDSRTISSRTISVPFNKLEIQTFLTNDWFPLLKSFPLSVECLLNSFSDLKIFYLLNVKKPYPRTQSVQMQLKFTSLINDWKEFLTERPKDTLCSTNKLFNNKELLDAIVVEVRKIHRVNKTLETHLVTYFKSLFSLFEDRTQPYEDIEFALIEHLKHSTWVLEKGKIIFKILKKIEKIISFFKTN